MNEMCGQPRKSKGGADLIVESTHSTSPGEGGPSIHSRWNAQSIIIAAVRPDSSAKNRPGQILRSRTSEISSMSG